MSKSKERLVVLVASSLGKSTAPVVDFDVGSLLLSSKHYPEQDAAQDNGQEHVKDRPFYAHRDRRHPHKPTGVAKARRAKKRKK